jgi:arylsulfatase A-like enzyme
LFKRNLYDFLEDIPNLSYISGLYDAEVAYLDHEFGRLISHLEQLGILDETMVVVFADHGENMTEHDAWFDHAGLYDSVVRVPVLMRYPKLGHDLRVAAPVQLVDLMPTMLEVIGDEVPSGTDGTSLLPLLRGQELAERLTVLSECTWQASRGVRTDRWKYIHCYDPGVYETPDQQLFDLLADPEEQVNLASRHPGLVAAMERELSSWVDEQLAGRPDPMRLALAEGLPAVRRLEGVIAEESAAVA